MIKNDFRKNKLSVLVNIILILLFSSTLSAFASATVDPSAPDYQGRKGATLYVSKTGDNSDGSSWKKAYHKIQAALLAIPDDKGGHTIIVRPDTYVEDNIYTAYKGAKGAYNLLIGDSDGHLGSGATGQIIIDAGDPEKGFKSWDWWGTIRTIGNGRAYGAEGWKQIKDEWKPDPSEPLFSSNCWDRWILRNLYASGSDAGFFWDFGDNNGEGFTVIVEDCVSIGRAFGGGVCYPFVRPDEPSVFRRCYFLAMDWVGDTGAVLVGGSEETMPAYPHLVMEDCTLVHPDNALAMSYASKCARVKVVRCRFIVLNFTQPEMGGKSTGIICTQGHGPKGKLHVDLENSILAGYSVFTNGEDGLAVSYTTKGKVQAYVQFAQSLPDGFERLGLWPRELFEYIAIPGSGQLQPFASASVKVSAPVDAGGRPLIKKLGSIAMNRMENSIIVFKEKAYSFYARDKGLFIERLTGRRIELPAGVGGGLDNAFVNNDTIYITQGSNMWVSADMKHWEKGEIKALQGFGTFNTSICKAEDQYVLMFEIDKPKEQAGTVFTARFATSKDMKNWTVTPPECNYAKDRYTAPHCLRYLDGYFYNFYLECVQGYQPHGHGFETCVVRSKDLIHWERSPFTVLGASPEDRLLLNPDFSNEERQRIASVGNINNSDIDLCEYQGKVLIQYAWGDQSQLGDDIAILAEAVYEGTMEQFLRGWFPEIKNYLPRVDPLRYYDGSTGVSSALSNSGSATPKAIK